MSYRIMRDGQVYGPYTANDLRRFASDGRLKVDDQVRAGGTNRWVLAGSVSSLGFGQHSRQPPSEAPQGVAAPEDAAESQVTDGVSNLMVLARHQSRICVLVLLYIVCAVGIGGFVGANEALTSVTTGAATDQGPPFYPVGIWLLFTALSIVPLWQMARALGTSKPNSSAYCVAYVLPGVGLVVLYRLSNLATNRLRRAGLKVGLIGVSRAQIRQLQTSGVVRTGSGDDTAAPDVGAMRRFGRLGIYAGAGTVIVVVALVLFSSLFSEDLSAFEEQVRTSIRETFAEDPEFVDVTVGQVKLVRSARRRLRGTVELMRDGVVEQVKVSVVELEGKFRWEIQ